MILSLSKSGQPKTTFGYRDTVLHAMKASEALSFNRETAPAYGGEFLKLCHTNIVP